jgi:Kef-type K+ transport system membrane component KefB
MTDDQPGEDVADRTSGRAKLGMVAGLLALVGALALWGPDLLNGNEPGSRGTDPAARFLLAAAVVLLVCHLVGDLLCQVGQPPVLGEIVGGLLLGPSALGAVWPHAQDWIFPPDVLGQLDRAAQLGLIIFMFVLGSELRSDRLDSPRVIGAVVTGSTAVPLLAGTALAFVVATDMAPGGHRSAGYLLFVGVAMAITALPVLARILIDLRLVGSRLGALAISTAAIGDGLVWTLLALTLTFAKGDGVPPDSVSWWATAGLALAFVLFVALVVRPALAALERPGSSSRRALDRGDYALIILVVGAIVCAAITDVIGLHPVLGAFLFGTAVPRGSATVRQISRRIQGFALTILLPLFFAGVGLNTSIGLLGSDPGHWLVFLAVLLVAVVAKFVGAGGAARLAGLPATESLQLGVLMNCRGLTELLVAAIGLQYHLISRLGFTILVLVAVVTTAATNPLMRLLMRHESAVG